jgi:hypothetical protein
VYRIKWQQQQHALGDEMNGTGLKECTLPSPFWGGWGARKLTGHGREEVVLEGTLEVEGVMCVLITACSS